jgi:predicted nucleotidyltransferase
VEAIKSEIRDEKPTIADHPALLWFKQQARRLTGQASLQEDILQTVVNEAMEDENVIGVLLFGSVAEKTHKWKSDIDMIFIYDHHEPASGLVNYYVSGVEVQYFYATLENLIENAKTVPYLLHMFSEAQVLFDRHGSVTPAVDKIRRYFATHPEIQQEWVHIKELHQVEKTGPQCQQTTIIERWDELEDKYSGGVRKRTFFFTR